MKQLYIFNPENDLALASDSPHFTPPTAAIKLRHDAAMLPVWIAGNGDYVLASQVDRAWFDILNDKLDLPATLVDAIPEDISKVVPWGWSRYIRHQLLKNGVPEMLLPDDSELRLIRDYSHRRTTIDIYNKLYEYDLPYPLPLKPIEITAVDCIIESLHRDKHLFIKSPLSGSGRGVLDTTSAPERQVLRLAEGMIHRQGSIIMEKRFDKIVDFAMLFDMVDGRAVFLGYSSFFNSNYSTYSGNILLPEDKLVDYICGDYVPVGWIYATRDALAMALESVLGDKYNGPVGIDMMIYHENGSNLIVPCVEANMRMTMGRVALNLSKCYIAPDVKGIMQIVQNKHVNTFNDMKIVNGQLTAGTLYLTPPENNDFSVVMCVEGSL